MVKRKVYQIAFLMIVESILLACSETGHKPLPKTLSQSANPSPTSEPAAYESARLVIQTRCARCHNAGPLNWGDKNTLMRVVRNGLLKEKISSGIMPQKGSPEASEITAAERQKILTWAQAAMTTKSSPDLSGSTLSATAETIAVVKDRNFAFVFQCMACHGQFGTSASEAFPNLAGHGRDYILTRVTHFLSPASTGLMPDQVKRIAKDFGLENKVSAEGKVELSEDSQALFNFAANYFSQFIPGPSAAEVKTRREAFDQNQKAQYEIGKTLFASSCINCHTSASLQPLPIAPMLFAQKPSYLARRFAEFKSGSGGNVMPGLVQTLTQEQLDAVAFFVTNTHVTEVRSN